MDTERASSQRFKVAYVEDKKLPPLTVISKDFDEREELLQFEKRMVAAGTKEDEMEASMTIVQQPSKARLVTNWNPIKRWE